MKCQALLGVLALFLFTEVIFALPYLEQEETNDDYNDNLDRLLQNSRTDSYVSKRRDEYPIKLLSQLYKRQRQRRCNSKSSRSCTKVRRSCVKRGGSCDHRPNDCCYSSSCRCNFWGSNCKCERMGLFQQWGK